MPDDKKVENRTPALSSMTSQTQNQFVIRQMLEEWALWRDAGEWEKLRSLWHDEGRMITTWCNTDANDFVANCRKTFEAGNIATHSLGGSSIDFQGERAVSQTRVQIVFRNNIHDVDVIACCNARFLDAWWWSGQRWGIMLRQTIYDLDWLELENPSASLQLDQELLGRYPIGYRHIAYLQTKMGLVVATDLPTLHGSSGIELATRFANWLADGANDDLFRSADDIA